MNVYMCVSNSGCVMCVVSECAVCVKTLMSQPKWFKVAGPFSVNSFAINLIYLCMVALLVNIWICMRVICDVVFTTSYNFAYVQLLSIYTYLHKRCWCFFYLKYFQLFNIKLLKFRYMILLHSNCNFSKVNIPHQLQLYAGWSCEIEKNLNEICCPNL